MSDFGDFCCTELIHRQLNKQLRKVCNNYQDVSLHSGHTSAPEINTRAYEKLLLGDLPSPDTRVTPLQVVTPQQLQRTATMYNFT